MTGGSISSRLPFGYAQEGGIYSFEVGSRKPEPEIYHKALDVANAKAENSLFIDDLIENIEIARSMDINTIHFKTIENFNSQLNQFIQL